MLQQEEQACILQWHVLSAHTPLSVLVLILHSTLCFQALWITALYMLMLTVTANLLREGTHRVSGCVFMCMHMCVRACMYGFVCVYMSNEWAPTAQELLLI